MSLINDALKKAQKQRAEEALAALSATPPPTGATARPFARQGRQPLSGTTIALIALGAATLIAVSVGVTVILLHDRPAVVAQSTAPAHPNTIASPGEQPPTAATSVAPATMPSAHLPPPAAAPAIASSPLSNTTTPATPAPAPAVASTTATSSAPPPPAASSTTSPAIAFVPVVASAPASVPTPAPTAAPTPTPEPPVIVSLLRAEVPEPPKFNPRTQLFVDKLRVNGIRTSSTGGKALLNDRLFRENEMIEPSLGLRLTRIEPNLLTFTDAGGIAYLRRF